MKRWGNWILAFAAPLVFLALLEFVLYLSGIRPLYLTEDPFVGFSSTQPLFVERDSAGIPMMVTNPPKLEHFNRQSFPVHKAPGTYRIFSVGGSTAYGHPWKDATSFSGWLREFLPEADKSKKWEVINAGGISYASYREARLIEEFVNYQPDLFIVYSGHNEFLEERTYRKAAGVPVLLRETSAWLDHTRTYTAMRLLLRKLTKENTASGSASPGAKPTNMADEVDDVLQKTIGPTSYTRNDTLRHDVLEHYRVSLERMARLAHSVGAQVIFLTTPGNEKDCSPFKSEPKPGLSEADRYRVNELMNRAAEADQAGQPASAWDSYRLAASIDDRNAGILYRAGQAAFALKKFPEAKRLFRRSLDEDICPLRALTPMRDIVVTVARDNHAELVDMADILEKKTLKEQGHNILGEPDFVDHVHLSIEDYRMMALAILDKLKQMGAAHPGSDWGDATIGRISDQVMSKMDSHQMGVGLHNVAKVLNWAGKHEDAARVAEKALAKDTTDLEAIWSSLFVGAARERAGKEAEAIPHYRRAVRLDPNNPMSHHYLGAALMRAGLNREAAEEFSTVLKWVPDDAETMAQWGLVDLRMGEFKDAALRLSGAVAAAPNRAEWRYLLAEALLQSGNIPAAEEQYHSLLAANPMNAEALAGLGKAAEKRGDKAAAINYFAQALNINPQLSEAQDALNRNLQMNIGK